MSQSKHFIPKHVREYKGDKIIFRKMNLLDYVTWIKIKFYRISFIDYARWIKRRKR